MRPCLRSGHFCPLSLGCSDAPAIGDLAGAVIVSDIPDNGAGSSRTPILRDGQDDCR